jgi:hypothetical protein
VQHPRRQPSSVAEPVEIRAVVMKESKGKSKAVPLHAMEAHGVRGGTAPTHS